MEKARAQDVHSVLNPNYSPQTEEDAHIFQDIQNSMCSFFSTNLQTERGKKFVRENDDDFDSQAVFHKSHNFYTTYEGFRLNASDMISYITSAKVESWKSTIEYFTLDRYDQIRLHKSIFDSHNHFS